MTPKENLSKALRYLRAAKKELTKQSDRSVIENSIRMVSRVKDRIY
jgi:hypothetical protein